jgi:glycerol kinase
LYVGNLSKQITDAQLNDLAVPYGTLVSANVATERSSGESKGFGFVEFGSDDEARAAITGLSFSARRAHIVRAALEAQAHQAHDLLEAFAADGVRWEKLRIDGGMAANNWLAQDLADMLDLPVERPAFVETTALGAAMLAAVGIGIYPDLKTAAEAMRGEVTRFEPKMDASKREERLSGWKEALARV